MKKLKEILGLLDSRKLKNKKKDKIDYRGLSRQALELNSILNNNLMF